MARRIGLSDVHVAKVTTNTTAAYECAEPVKLFRAITGSVSVKRTSEAIYSDDMVEENISALDAIEVEFEGNNLSSEMYALLFGAKYEEGVLIETADDKASEVALGFRSKMSDGTYTFVWMYCGTLGMEDSESYETKAAGATPQSKTVKGTFYPRQMDGAFRKTVNECELSSENTDAKTMIADWFAEVK